MYGTHNQERDTSRRNRSRSRGRYYTGNNGPATSSLNDFTSGSINAPHYEPQGRGSRGRGDGGRTPHPGRAHPRPTGYMTTPQPRHPTPLTRLHRNPSLERSVSWGTNDTKHIADSSTPITIDIRTGAPPIRPEMEKTDSTEVINDLTKRIFNTDLEDLTLDHFSTPGLPDGKSLLLTMVVNQAHHLQPDLESTQLARIAAHTVSRHPKMLLEYLQNSNAARTFITMALAATPLYPHEHILCPMDTPLLLDATLRERLTHLNIAPPSELRRIITPFLQCFYPGTWEQLEQTVRKAPDSSLQNFITHPGALHHHLLTTDPFCTFSPPRWVTLSHLFTNHTINGTTESSEDDDSTGEESPPLLCPLTTMGFTEESFDRLAPEQQKRVVLSVLPSRMADTIPAALMGPLMLALSEMADQSIRGALEPHTFHKLLYHDTYTSSSTAKLPQTYFYRFRLQNKNKGTYSWTQFTAGMLLRHWLSAWVPMFFTSHYTLTLTRHPTDKQLRPINLSHIDDIPPDTELESYTTEHVIQDGSIEQFDIWLITECEDLANNGAASFTRNTVLSDTYTNEIHNNGIRSMKMERYPRGWIPCILLGNSLLHDSPWRITQELLSRVSHLPPIDPKTIRVEYVTVHTTSRRPQVMCHCVFVEQRNYTRITKLCTLFAHGDETTYPVTGAYKLLVLPNTLTSSFDQELNQALIQHLSYMHSNTHSTILEVPNVDIFHFVPDTPKMVEVRTGTGHHTIYTLLRHGSVVRPDGTLLFSPVRRVAADEKRNRIHLYAEKQHAQDLVTFTSNVTSFIPFWIPGCQEPRADNSDAIKTIRITARALDREKDNNTTGSISSTTTQHQQTHSSDNPSQSLSNQPDGVYVPKEEWSKAMDLISQMAQHARATDKKLQSTDEKMDRILEHLQGIPHSTFPKGFDDVISTITQTITSSSDSLKEYGHQMADSVKHDISSTMASNAGKVADFCNGLQRTNTQVSTDVTSAMSQLSEIADRIRHIPLPHIIHTQEQPLPSEATNEHTPTSLTPPAIEPQAMTNVTASSPVPPNTQVDSQIPTDPSQVHSPNFESLAQDSSEDDLVVTQLSSSPSPTNDRRTSGFAHCYGCNKIDGDTEACDHCELPHHQQCLIKAPTDGNNCYCIDCMQALFPNSLDQQPNPSSSEDSVLSEHSNESEYSSNSRTVRQARNQADTPPQRYKLRTRNK